MQYVGEVFSVDTALGRSRVQEYKQSTCTYLMQTTNGEVIDPTKVGNVARLINHSCEPNCRTQKWHVLGEICVGIFTVRDIQENEELSFDYQFDFFKTPFTRCYCGTPQCKGFLGVRPTTDGGEVSAPQCGYCKRAVTDRTELVVCRGASKEAFHLECVMRKEGKRALDKAPFVCKSCRSKQRDKAVDQVEGDVVSQAVCPWDSEDPGVRQYYEDSPENRLLDQIIAREYLLVEQSLQGKRRQQFSRFYNFMSELTKRLKQRIKSTEGKTQFRRHKRAQPQENFEVVLECTDERMEDQKEPLEETGAQEEMQQVIENDGQKEVPLDPRDQEEADGDEEGEEEAEEEQGVEAQDSAESEQEQYYKEDFSAEEEEEEEEPPGLSKFLRPRRTSFLEETTNALMQQHQEQMKRAQQEAAEEKAALHSLVSQKLEAFVKEQLYLANANLEDMSEVKETKLNLYEPVFLLAIPPFIEDYQCLPGFQVYWDPPWGGMVTLKIVSTFRQFTFLATMLQDLTDILTKSRRLGGPPTLKVPFTIVVIQVPKNFLRRLVGYQEKNLATYRRQYQVDFDCSRDIQPEEVYVLSESLPLRVFGYSDDVVAVNAALCRDLELIQMKTFILLMQDCKIILDYLTQVKLGCDPCELKVKKMVREWKDIRHPFYYIPNYFRELVLVGTKSEIDAAERFLEQFLKEKRELSKLNLQQISYLLPNEHKGMFSDFKNEILLHFNFNIQIFLYEPSFPRKHITLLMIGDWKILLEAKAMVERFVNGLVLGTHGSFDLFQRYTYHQQIRFSFKSLKRYVLELDINYLNHWDMVSFYIEEAMRDEGEGYGAFMRFIREEDVETCLNILFVLTNSEPEKLESLMRAVRVGKRESIEMMANVLKLTINDHKESIKYFHRSYNYKFGYFNKPLLNYIDHSNVQSAMRGPSPRRRTRSGSYHQHHNHQHNQRLRSPSHHRHQHHNHQHNQRRRSPSHHRQRNYYHHEERKRSPSPQRGYYHRHHHHHHHRSRSTSRRRQLSRERHQYPPYQSHYHGHQSHQNHGHQSHQTHGHQSHQNHGHQSHYQNYRYDYKQHHQFDHGDRRRY